MAGKRIDWEQNLGRLRELLYSLLRSREHPSETVVEMLEILDRLDGIVRSTVPSVTSVPVLQDNPRFRRNKPKSYRIERHGNGFFLAEHREGGRQPYLCPQDVYDAFANQMAKAAEPAHFEVLMEGTAELLGRTPPDYLLRTCLRFWMAGEPPLVEKVRTRYRPIRPNAFSREARKAWRVLAESSDR